MATVEVILKQKIEGLGAEADVVKVKRGFARNFLLPQNQAYEATKANLRHVARLQEVRTKREADELAEAENIAAKLKKLRLSITLSLGQGGKAFGSVTNMDIHKELEAAGIQIDRHSIQLDKPIKKSGKTEVEIRLNPHVTATLTITVDAGDVTEED